MRHFRASPTSLTIHVAGVRDSPPSKCGQQVREATGGTPTPSASLPSVGPRGLFPEGLIMGLSHPHFPPRKETVEMGGTFLGNDHNLVPL